MYNTESHLMYHNRIHVYPVEDIVIIQLPQVVIVTLFSAEGLIIVYRFAPAESVMLTLKVITDKMVITAITAGPKAGLYPSFLTHFFP